MILVCLIVIIVLAANNKKLCKLLDISKKEYKEIRKNVRKKKHIRILKILFIILTVLLIVVIVGGIVAYFYLGLSGIYILLGGNISEASREVFLQNFENLVKAVLTYITGWIYLILIRGIVKQVGYNDYLRNINNNDENQTIDKNDLDDINK